MTQDLTRHIQSIRTAQLHQQEIFNVARQSDNIHYHHASNQSKKKIRSLPTNALSRIPEDCI